MASANSFHSPLLLSLIGVMLASGRVTAQPMYPTSHRTIEARVAQAEHVVVATIDKVSHEVLDAKIGSPLGGPFKYTVTLKIGEVLKGDLQGTVDDLRAKHGWRADDRYDEWSKAGTTLLCFLGPTPKMGERREWDFIPLGKRVPAEGRLGERRDGPPLFSMDFTLLKDDADVLARARAYAKAWPKATCSIEISPYDFLIVPVDPTLEKLAKRLIRSPGHFLPKDKKRDPQSRETLCGGGVKALRYFKSNANADLLRKILASANESVLLRARGCEVLLHWDVDVVPLPESAQGITELDLAGTNVTDKGLKQLSGLKNLTTLKLQDTNVTAAGLKELAGLKRLATLLLSEGQLSDASFRVLCETGLMHTLAYQIGGSNRIGGSPDANEDIVAIGLCYSPVTDAGLRELARFSNLARLDLSETRVTDAGLKELAGLKNLTTVELQGTQVTEAGVAELQKALPKCKIRRLGKRPDGP
jgi:hypothetical protein